jgi:hypothetical protein
VRILFVARHFTYFRNYDSVLRGLARAGHELHLAVEKDDVLGGRRAVSSLAAEHPSITLGDIPARHETDRADVVRRLRHGIDYLRYLDPFYDGTPLLRARARNRTPLGLVRLAEANGAQGWRRLLARLLDRVDRAVPPPDVIVEYLRAQHPDVLLITPLVDLGSQQIDVLRAARQLGIPTALAVWSWDHLSSKAYIREHPQRVLVWNETQRGEAVALHGLDPGRIVVTGAQCFDHWFDRRPSRDRATFCAALGLPADRPMVLYVCSGFIHGSPPEPPFVREWLVRLRASADPRLASAAVLIRPHPAKTAHWEGIDLEGLGPVAVWGGNPIDESTRADYFDSLYHSTAVVGVNTSAFIEAAIVGREVLAVLPAEFHDNHEGTAHFRYLLDVGGGMLRVSRDLDAHVAQLSAALEARQATDHPHRGFLEAFVRPRGMGVPATPAFVEAVEQLRGVAVAAGRERPAFWSRRVAEALTRRLKDPAYETWFLSERELDSVNRVRAAKAGQLAASRRIIDGEEPEAALPLPPADLSSPEAAKAARAAEKARQLAEKRARVDADRRRSRSIR